MTANPVDVNSHAKLSTLGQRVLSGGQITRDEATWLFNLETSADILDLLSWANRIREQFKGNKIHLCSIVNAKAGSNPHLWYAPATMPAVAKAIAAAFTKTDSAHAADYAANLDKTLAQLARISQRVGQIRDKHKGKAVTATEPVFGLMAGAVGLTMRNEKFQLAMMNDTEPSARDIAAFEDDLKNHKVKAMIYNKQVSEKLTERLLAVAQKAKVPVIAVTETQPQGVTFTEWMLGELDSLDKALDGANS